MERRQTGAGHSTSEGADGEGIGPRPRAGPGLLSRLRWRTTRWVHLDRSRSNGRVGRAQHLGRTLQAQSLVGDQQRPELLGPSRSATTASNRRAGRTDRWRLMRPAPNNGNVHSHAQTVWVGIARQSGKGRVHSSGPPTQAWQAPRLAAVRCTPPPLVTRCHQHGCRVTQLGRGLMRSTRIRELSQPAARRSGSVAKLSTAPAKPHRSGPCRTGTRLPIRRMSKSWTSQKCPELQAHPHAK